VLVRSSSGSDVTSSTALARLKQRHVIVPGYPPTEQRPPKGLLETPWGSRGNNPRVMSICTGAFGKESPATRTYARCAAAQTGPEFRIAITRTPTPAVIAHGA
jgi:hypothetical protein